MDLVRIMKELFEHSVALGSVLLVAIGFSFLAIGLVSLIIECGNFFGSLLWIGIFACMGWLTVEFVKAVLQVYKK